MTGSNSGRRSRPVRRAISVVWNGRTRRLRAPWRLLVGFVVLSLFGLLVAVLSPVVRPSLAALFGFVASAAQATAAAGNVVFLVSQVVVYVATVYLVGRFVDRRWIRDFGFHLDRDWWLDLGFGLALGAGLMTGVFAVELLAGWVVVVGTFRIAQPTFAFWPWFGLSLVTFVAIGFTEELLARGYLVTNLAEGFTWFDRLARAGAVGAAVCVSSAVFAWGHFTNPNATLASTAGIFVAGVMLAVGYVLTDDLAVPIGIHVTWNFFQGPVYGFPVSGIDFGLSLVATEQRGPRLVTGGAFGPEAGLLGVAASVAGIALVAAWVARRKGHLAVHPSLTTPDLRRGDGDG